MTTGFCNGISGRRAKLDKTLAKHNIKIGQNSTFGDKIVKGIGESVSKSVLENVIYGTDLEDALVKNLQGQLTNAATATVFSEFVKQIDADKGDQNLVIRNVSHKLAAALTGCISAAAGKESCEAGAIGAAVGEMFGDFAVDKNTGVIDEKQREQLVNQAKLLAGITAAFSGNDVNTAADKAGEAVRWNALQPKEWREFSIEIQKNCYHNTDNINCQDSLNKWKEKSYKEAKFNTQNDRINWEDFVLTQYKAAFDVCGHNQICNYRVSTNMLASMVKFAGMKSAVQQEAYSTQIAANTFLSNKSSLTLMAVNDFGWMVDVG